MTYKEKLMLEHPEEVSESAEGGCYGCPDSYGYEDYSDCDGVEDGCEECWNREIPEEEKRR